MALVSQAALNNVYNHYLTSYAPRSTSRYDTHKKSELRSIYNSIIKQNKTSPLYLIDINKDVRQFAVGMKENARELKNTISSLSSGNPSHVLDQKTAFSSDEGLIQAKYIGTDDDGAADFEVEVKQLASSQVNLGSYLPDDACELPPDTYSFDLHIGETDYEFQFNINKGDTNRELQEKISNLLNRSNVGIASSVIDNEEGGSALRLESTATGVPENEDSLFRISDDNTSRKAGAVDYFGIGEITSVPSDALFFVDHTAYTANTNTFTAKNDFVLTFRGITAEDSPVTIGLKPDVESMSDNIHQLINSYNQFLSRANIYSGSNINSGKLISEMSRITNAYRSDLDTMGLTPDDNDGHISIDDRLLSQTLGNEEESEFHMNTIQNFAGSLVHKSNQISLNPMNYVDKIVVAYKNPAKAFANPYISSIYSGMLFNSYC